MYKIPRNLKKDPTTNKMRLLRFQDTKSMYKKSFCCTGNEQLDFGFYSQSNIYTLVHIQRKFLVGFVC